MANLLQKYFPMIRTQEEVLIEIQENQNLNKIFQSWNDIQQKIFLDSCTGVRGVKVLYDGFFKAIMNPDAVPERLEDFISALFAQKVKIVKVLPLESRISDKTLSILDIVVELADGSVVNVEVQKVGYLFPGQRCACYSADLLLRQYTRVKNELGESFIYKHIKNVYTIVLFEKSPKEFKHFPEIYVHRMEATSDSGIQIDLLQKYIFIPLDIFKRRTQNETIGNKLDAWLTFFSSDAPEDIVRLIETWPEFVPIYQDIYKLCRNMEDVMGFFSEELNILDENTAKYMIDELTDKLEERDKTVAKQEETIAKQTQTIVKREGTIADQVQTIADQGQTISSLQDQSKKDKERIRELEEQLKKQSQSLGI
jgi:hypothetical protein